MTTGSENKFRHAFQENIPFTLLVCFSFPARTSPKREVVNFFADKKESNFPKITKHQRDFAVLQRGYINDVPKRDYCIKEKATTKELLVLLIKQLISIMLKVFANGLGHQGSILGLVIEKTQKWYLMTPCLAISIIRYVSSVK